MSVLNPDYSDAQAVWDALMSVAGNYKSEFESNRDKAMGVISGALGNWGRSRVLGALNAEPWKRDYALNILRYSLGTGAPVYNRTGDGSVAKLVFVPGYRGTAAGQITGARGENGADDPYGRYDAAGRYLGFRSGLINGNYVY